MKSFVIIPALNESGTIADVVRGVARYADEVIVVDDCSTDGTAELAKSAGATVVQHATSTGYDASIDDGFREAYARGADTFITFDADGEHAPEYLPRFIEPIAQGRADLVMGQRPGTRHFAEKFFVLYTRLRFDIRDPLCGLKSYSRKVYETIGHFDTLKSIGTQLVIEAIRRGFRADVVPITLAPRRDESRFYAQRLRANWNVFKAMLRIMFLLPRIRIIKK